MITLMCYACLNVSVHFTVNRRYGNLGRRGRKRGGRASGGLRGPNLHVASMWHREK